MSFRKALYLWHEFKRCRNVVLWRDDQGFHLQQGSGWLDLGGSSTSINRLIITGNLRWVRMKSEWY